MPDEMKLRHALAWTGGAAIVIGLVQMMLTTAGSVTPRIWIIAGTSFVGQVFALIAASIVLGSLLRTKDAHGTRARIKQLIPYGTFALVAALVVGVIIGTSTMSLLEGVVASAIGTILGLQGIAAIWIAERALEAKVD